MSPEFSCDSLIADNSCASPQIPLNVTAIHGQIRMMDPVTRRQFFAPYVAMQDVLMTVMKMFIEMKTVRGLTHAYCPDCSLDMVLDEKYHSAKMGMDYPTNDKDGTMVLVGNH
ncbi:hypothetical protein BU17DRAFT_65683 [Hysterangium stoloniferum]|nr:hypothetical protein BU17DRAFT_65683 [Hysterangium stoloniferum]